MNPTQSYPPSTYHPSALIATDRRRALHEVHTLPTHSNGALLFADIVGFTALLEQVETRLGAKKGADVMTEQVNHLFTALIEQTHQHGGVVIAFGGDSISCWFAQTRDEDAAWQAVCCGLAMQHAMQNFAQIEIAPITPFSFALKVTIAAGKAIRLVVGDPQIQCFDLVAGEVVSKLAYLQPAARAGGVLLDGESAQRLAARLAIGEWINHQPESMAIITAITVDSPPVEPVTAHAFPALPEGVEKAWLLRPVYERLANGQGYFISELRSVVFLFLKFAGLHYQSDPEAGDKVDRYLRTVQQTLTVLGGYLLKVTIDDKGSYLLAAFGAPLSHEEDLVNRALRAALRLRQQSQHFTFIERVAIGISQAQLLAGIFGAPQRAAFDLLGKEVNLLNRVVNQTPAGQIVVTQVIEAQARQKYTFGPATALRLRGITEAVAIFELLSTHLPPLPTLHHEWIGRVAEQQTLNDLWQKVMAQQGQILEMEGAAGLGKSHLALRFLQSLSPSDGQIVYAACESTMQQTPYSLWRLIVPQLVAITHTADAAHWDDDAFWANTDGQGTASSPLQTFLPNNRQERIFADLLALIRTAVAPNRSAPSIPLVLVLDDLHWIDEASYKLTVSLSRQIADLPIFLILLRRPLVAGAGTPVPELSYLSHYQRLVIAEFSDDEVAELLATRLLAKVSPLLLSLVTMLAQGNPFFINELLLTLQSRHLLQKERAKAQWTLSEEGFRRLQRANCLHRNPQSGDWLVAPDAPLTAVDLGLPNTIEQSILARLDQLAEPVRFTLKLASVVGRTFSPAVLLAAHPNRIEPPALQAQLQLLVQHNLLLPSPEERPAVYTFRHHLTQESVYTSLTATDRHRLHGAVGQALEALAPQGVEALAEHYWQGAVREKAIHYLEQAAQRAQRSSANQTALNYYNRLLELEPKHPLSLKGKVEVLHVLGLYDEEENTLNILSAYNIVHNELTDIEIYYLWGTYFLVKEEYERASAMFQTVCTLAQQSNDSIALARAFTQVGWIARAQNQISDSQAYYEKALALFERSNLTSEIHFYAHIDTLNGLGTLFRQKRRYPEAEALYIKALELSRTHHHHREEARALNNIGIVALYQRELDRAKTCCTQALMIRRSISDLFGEGACLSNIAAICSELGEYEEAIYTNIVAEKIHQSIGNSEGQINSAISLGIIYWQLGCLAEAKQTLEKGLKLAETAHDQIGCDYVRSNLGMVLRDMGDLDAAKDILAIGLASVRSYNDFVQEAVLNSYLATVFLEKKDFTSAEKHARNAMKIRETSELFAYTIDDLATLASIYLQMNQDSSALEQAKTIYHSLMDNKALKVEFPQRAWFICYQVFEATQQEELARVAITRAIQIITQHANKLRDPLLRNTYLTKVTLHHLINQAKQNDKMVDSDSGF